jgi:hypothetical protein
MIANTIFPIGIVSIITNKRGKERENLFVSNVSIVQNVIRLSMHEKSHMIVGSPKLMAEELNFRVSNCIF